MAIIDFPSQTLEGSKPLSREKDFQTGRKQVGPFFSQLSQIHLTRKSYTAASSLFAVDEKFPCQESDTFFELMLVWMQQTKGAVSRAPKVNMKEGPLQDTTLLRCFSQAITFLGT
jgi:hypothetical protein